MIHRTRTCLAIAILAITMGWHAGVLSFNPRIDLPKATAFVRDTYGDSAQTRVERWVEHLDQLKGKSEDLQLRSVNTFWNTTVREAEDISLWKQEDYWATPLESLGRQAGDCEDFVIGKYFSLLYLGVPAEKLRFIYVSATINGPTGRKTIAHMVLGYYPKPDADPLVLDNLNTEICLAASVGISSRYSASMRRVFMCLAKPMLPQTGLGAGAPCLRVCVSKVCRYERFFPGF